MKRIILCAPLLLGGCALAGLYGPEQQAYARASLADLPQRVAASMEEGWEENYNPAPLEYDSGAAINRSLQQIHSDLEGIESNQRLAPIQEYLWR